MEAIAKEMGQIAITEFYLIDSINVACDNRPNFKPLDGLEYLKKLNAVDEDLINKAMAHFKNNV